jgi:dTDP-4-dehydrorhamnose reductase
VKLLIVGASSAVGRELLRLLEQRGIEYVAPEPDRIKARDAIKAAKFITQCAPDQVVNLASFAAGSQLAVQQAESDRLECDAVNHLQASVLAQVCDHLNIPLIHLSSSYVFSGDKKLGYNEQDAPRPAGIYGETELLGEQAITAILEKYIILRTGWIFGPTQDEVIRQWIQNAHQQDGALSVLRRKFSPTPVEDVARVVLALSLQASCNAPVWGTYHYCGLETKRESEFVQQVLKLAAQYDEAIYRVLDHLNLTLARVDAPEVVNTTLATKKIFDTFGIKQRSWHGNLQNLIKSYYKA